jgi:hypothetical protein
MELELELELDLDLDMDMELTYTPLSIKLDHFGASGKLFTKMKWASLQKYNKNMQKNY